MQSSLALTVVAFMAHLALAAPARADDISYLVQAEISDDGSEVRGTATVTYRNAGDDALDHLFLLLYPTRFQTEETALNDLTRPRVFIGRFSGGDMVLEGIETEPVPFDLAPEGTYVRLALGEPLAPGEEMEVELPFVTTVPERFGSFGRHAWMVALNGGWSPMVATRGADGGWDLEAPPPPATWEVDLTYGERWSAVVNGLVQGAAGVEDDHTSGLRTAAQKRRRAPLKPKERVDLAEREGPGSGGGATGRGDAVFLPGRARVWTEGRFVTLVLHRRGEVTVVDTPEGAVTYVGLRPRRLQRKDLAGTANTALGMLRGLGLPGTARGTVVVEAPLRWRLLEQGEGCVLVTDRYLDQEPFVRRFAQTQLARAMVTDQLLPFAEDVEARREAPAVVEAVSWALLPRYLGLRHRIHLTAQDLLQPLDFLPSVEQFLYAPSYPFADEVLNNPYHYDPLRADIRRFHRGGIGPRTSLLKVKETVGTLSVDAAAVDYVGRLGGEEAAPYLTLLAERSDTDVRALWDPWERHLPTVNYNLEVERERREDGWTTRIRVTKEVPEGAPALPEPVDVRATVPPANGEPRLRHDLRWDGEGGSTEWTLDTARRVKRVQVDPTMKLLEIDRGGFIMRRDNALPPPIKIYPSGLIPSINVTEGTFEAFLGLSGRAAFDNRNLFSGYLSHNEETLLGAGFSYYRYFGRARDALFRRTRVGLHTSLTLLNPLFAEVPGQVPIIPVVTLSYRYADVYGGTFPTRGKYFYTSVHGGYAYAALLSDPDDDRTFVGFSVAGDFLLPFHPSLVLACRGKLGATTANLPHLQKVLGGNSDLRGLPEGFVTGHYKLFGGIELRGLFARDLNVQLPLMRVRGIQGNLFLEGGWVGDGAPQPEEWNWGIGTGVRFHVDWFGLWPANAGFDVAWSPRAPRGNLLPFPVQVYLVLGQSF